MFYSGEGDEAEKIRFEIDKFPGGLVEPTEAEGTDPVFEPGLGFDDGTATYKNLENKVPYLTGSFTGWRYKKMRPLFDVLTELDEDYMPAFDLAKAMGSVHRMAKGYDTLLKPEHKKEMKAYQEIRLKQVKNYSHDGWEAKQSLFGPYKKPFIVNGYEIMDIH
jgi:hypothetical protein